MVPFMLLILLQMYTFNAATTTNISSRWGTRPEPECATYNVEYGTVFGRCVLPNHRLQPQLRGFLLKNMYHNDISKEGFMEKQGATADEPTSNNEKRGSFYFQNVSPIPCTCKAESLQIRRDLGQGVYPRYLSNVVCNDTLCGNSQYFCQPQNRTIYVLKERNDGDRTGEDLSNSDLIQLPQDLRMQWKFEGITTTVACVCKRHGFHG